MLVSLNFYSSKSMIYTVKLRSIARTQHLTTGTSLQRVV